MIKIELNKLTKAKWNYKEEDTETTKKLIANIKRNGQIENLIVREMKSGKYEVINGNHRLDAMKELKLKKAWCFNMGTITTRQAKRIAVETNETRFDTDSIKLAEVMSDIMKDFEMDDLVATMPYDEKDMENFNTLLDFDWDQFQAGEATVLDEEGGSTNYENKCPKCGHEY